MHKMIISIQETPVNGKLAVKYRNYPAFFPILAIAKAFLSFAVK